MVKPRAICRLDLWCHRNRLGNRPHQAYQFSGDSADDLGRMLSAGPQASEAFTQAPLGLPTSDIGMKTCGRSCFCGPRGGWRMTISLRPPWRRWRDASRNGILGYDGGQTTMWGLSILHLWSWEEEESFTLEIRIEGDRLL